MIAWRTWLRRIIQNPIVTAALIFLLCRDVSYWRYWPIPFARTPMMDRLFPAESAARFSGHPAPFAFALLENGSIRIIDEDKQSWDELSRITTSRPGDLARMSLHVNASTKGLWARTALESVADVILIPIARQPNFTAKDNEAARAAFLDWCEAGSSAEWRAVARELRAGGISEHVTLWSGYVHNALSLLALLLTIYSLGWIPRSVVAAMTARTKRRLARGQCVHCGYSLAGLPAGKCPECGEWQFTEVE